MKNWVIAGVVVTGLFAVLFLSDRPAQTPSGLSIIRTSSQYVEANNKAAALALGIFQKAETGAVITDEDKAKLREAVKYFEAMQIYEPRHIASYFGAGKCLMLIGEKEKAGEKFAQAILNRGTDPDRDAPSVQMTLIESMGLLSEVTLDLAAEELGNANSAEQANDAKGATDAKKRAGIYYEQSLKYATAAVQAAPTGYRYLVDRANVYQAMGRKAEAKADIAKALALAPNDPKVQMAAKLIGR